jgi:hypothetical protein
VASLAEVSAVIASRISEAQAAPLRAAGAPVRVVGESPA